MIKNKYISVVVTLIMIPITLFILSALILSITGTFIGRITSSYVSNDEIKQLQQSYHNGTLNYDYESAESFETALNNRIKVTNKIVSFEAIRVAPNSIVGFNVFAGIHLNFRSNDKKDISESDQVTVVVTNAIKIFGSTKV